MKIQDMEARHEGWRPNEQEVADFLKTLPLCSLATLSPEGSPQVARVAFSVHEGLRLIVGTSLSSRKAWNVCHDERVALEATDAEKRYTVQYEGRARILGKEEFRQYANSHYEQLPASRPFRGKPDQCEILVTPTWIRFSDCSPNPWVLSEYAFND